jgi:transcriptional regulator with XRE-family HTH domain
MARTALGWGVRDLANAADVAPATVTRFESGRGMQSRTIEAMRNALEAGGIVFIPENGGGAGVRFKNKG